MAQPVDTSSRLLHLSSELKKSVSAHKSVIEALSDIQHRFKELNQFGEEDSESRTSDKTARAIEPFQKLPEEVVVVLTGETNAGKSTLVNEILRSTDDSCAPLTLPADETPTTARLTRLVHERKPFIRTLDKNGEALITEEPRIKSVEKLDLSNIILDLKQREDSTTVSEVVEIGWPHDLLKSGLVLYDMPGLGENDAIDDTVNNFFKEYNTCFVLYVVSGQAGLASSDSAALQKLRGYQASRGNKKIMYLINKLDYDVQNAILCLDDDVFDEVDYNDSMEDEITEENEKCRKNAIEVCLNDEKLSTPQVRVDAARKKLQEWTESTEHLVIPVSGRCLGKFLSNKELHEDEEVMVKESVEMLNHLKVMIERESKGVFLSVTSGMTELMEPMYRNMSIEVALANYNRRTAQHMESDLRKFLDSLFERLEGFLESFQWKENMLVFCTSYTVSKQAKEYTRNFIRLKMADFTANNPVGQTRERMISRVVEQIDESCQLECRKLLKYLMGLCENVCYISLLKINKLLKNHLENEWSQCSEGISGTTTSSFEGGSLKEGNLPEKYTFKTLYTKALMSEFQRKQLYQIIAEKFLEKYLTREQQKDIVAMSEDKTQKLENKILKIYTKLFDDMKFSTWEIMLGKDKIMEKLLKRASDNLIDSHHKWCASVKKLSKQWRGQAEAEDKKMTEIQSTRQQMSRLLIEIYSIEYQQRKDLALGEVIDSMKKLAEGEESQIFTFQKNQHAKKIAIRKIQIKNLSDERIHRNCSHLIKSRWLKQPVYSDKGTTSAAVGHRRESSLCEEEIKNAMNHLLLVMWWIFDREECDLLVATKVAGDNLAKHLHSEQLPLATRLEYGRQLILAIRLLHDTGICHGDLRPEAVLLSAVDNESSTDSIAPPHVMINMAKAPDATRKMRLADGKDHVAFHIAPDRYHDLLKDLRQPHHDVYALGSLLWLLVEGTGMAIPKRLEALGDLESKDLHPFIEKEVWFEPPANLHSELNSVYQNAIVRCWRCTADDNCHDVLLAVDRVLQQAIIHL